ncbi:MAG: hypothetical protein IK066_09285 [Kiritimatiellae bacterium]|nr:hypothetical protein [Kiritimatiellia bacterium]
MGNLKKALERFAACAGGGRDHAALLREFRDESGEAFLRQLANASPEGEKLLTREMLAEWPGEEAGVYAEFVASMPYRPDPRRMPCGRKERFIAAALGDRSVPKPKRVALWRAFAMGGCKFPRFSRGEWDVPRELADHASVRGWICATRQPGWTDLRNSDPRCFSEEREPAFRTAFEKEAWEAIGRDSPAELMMPLALMGKNLPPAYFREALRMRAEKIIACLLDDSGRSSSSVRPREILFYACANWNDAAAVPVVAMLEKASPGVVAESVDRFGHDALWYTLYQRDERGRVTPAARRGVPPLVSALVERGCDPSRECILGLSWRDVVETGGE